jgi:hypothetical protein
MKKGHALLYVCIMISINIFADSSKIEVPLSLNDTFIVQGKENWAVETVKSMPLRFSDIKIRSTKGYPFSLMLYFKADTSDLAIFNTPEKMKRSVLTSSRKYLPYIVEKQIDLKRDNPGGRYGFYATLTDKKMAEKETIPKNEFKHITRGMIRLSDDSALGFSLMTNDLDSPEYKNLMGFLQAFVKEQK